MADPDEPTGDLAGEESLDYLERMDEIAAATSLGQRTDPRDPRIRSEYAKLTPPQLARIARLTASGLANGHALAVARLMSSGRAESLRDDELVEMARIAAKTSIADRATWITPDSWSANEAYAALPRIKFGITTLDDVIEFRAGENVVVVGPSGAFKSSFGFQVAVAHVAAGGVSIILSAELPTVHVVAKIVALNLLCSWRAALNAQVPPDLARKALDMGGRLAVLSGAHASIEEVGNTIDVASALHHDATILLVIDYLQIARAGRDQLDARARVAHASSMVRELAATRMIGTLVLSQASRANQSALRSGEKSGTGAIGTGAETSVIENDASVQLTLGEIGPLEPDGRRSLEISVAKHRAGEDDLSIPFQVHAPSGRFEPAGGSRSAAAHREQLADTRRDDAVATARERVVQILRETGIPLTRGDIRDQLEIHRPVCKLAIDQLLRDGTISEEKAGKKVGGYWPLVATLPTLPRLYEGSAQSSGQTTAEMRRETLPSPLERAESLGELGEASEVDGQRGGSAQNLSSQDEDATAVDDVAVTSLLAVTSLPDAAELLVEAIANSGKRAPPSLETLLTFPKKRG